MLLQFKVPLGGPREQFTGVRMHMFNIFPPPKHRDGLNYKEAARLIILAAALIFIIINFQGFLSVLKYLFAILSPVILGLMFALVLNLPMNWFESKLLRGDNKVMNYIRRPLAVILSLFVILSLLALVVFLVVPQSLKAIQQIVSQMPTITANLGQWAQENKGRIPTFVYGWLSNLGQDFPSSSENLLKNFGLLGGGLLSGITGILGGVVTMILGVSFAIFMLLGKETLIRQVDLLMRVYLNPEGRLKVKRFIDIVVSTFSKYINGQVKEAIVVGIVCTALLLVFRFPFATVIGPVTGISSLIPMVGAWIGGIAGFLLILTVNPPQAFLFILFILAFQQLDGLLIYPKVVGDSVGLPALWVFFAITVGASLFGFIGTFLGVPVLAVIFRLLRLDVDDRLKMQDQGMSQTIQVIRIPKGKDSVRLVEPTLDEIGKGELAEKNTNPSEQ